MRLAEAVALLFPPVTSTQSSEVMMFQGCPYAASDFFKKARRAYSFGRFEKTEE
jgi:hypothetical protein